MSKILGLHKVKAALAKLKNRFGRSTPSVFVGYTANYAVYVHENKEAAHTAGTQAKFLEEPARTNSKEIAGNITTALKAGAKLDQALLLGGLRLQRESQRLVPVDVGALKASAFTAIDRDVDAAMAAATSRFEAEKAKGKKR